MIRIYIIYFKYKLFQLIYIINHDVIPSTFSAGKKNFKFDAIEGQRK